MSSIIYDISLLYQQTFGRRPYRIEEANSIPSSGEISSDKGNLLKMDFEGREIWLPIKFTGLDPLKFTNGELLLPYATIKIGGKKTIIKTPMPERGGSVKEFYSIDDYSITIKGFLIDSSKRLWPESEIIKLKNLWIESTAVAIDNAITNLFLGTPGAADSNRVIIEKIDFPEMEGKRMHIRPFSMTLESDNIFTLDV